MSHASTATEFDSRRHKLQINVFALYVQRNDEFSIRIEDSSSDSLEQEKERDACLKFDMCNRVICHAKSYGCTMFFTNLPRMKGADNCPVDETCHSQNIRRLRVSIPIDRVSARLEM